MPKTIMDYSKTIMYKIVCNDLNVKDCYVGHTINMTKRKWAHKSRCHNDKDKKHNLKIYQIIRENGGWSNWSMLLVEEFPCKDKYEACKRERELYEEIELKMNMVIPYRTQEDLKEYHKQYYQEHKAEIVEKKKQYYQDHKADLKQYEKLYREEHKEKIKEYHKLYREEHKEKIKEKVECKYCAKLLSKQYMSRHHKTCKSIPVKE